MENNKPKYYSYFCFDKKSKFGSVKGKIFNLKTSTFEKDGQTYDKLNFALACNNIDKKAKYILDVDLAVNTRNPETTFVDCVAFGDDATRMAKYLHQNDEILATGTLSHSERKSGIKASLVIKDALLIKKYGENPNKHIEESQVSSNDIDDDDDDEIPF